MSKRLQPRFPSAKLVEINAFSMFSKYFSESGKLVTKLFDEIEALLSSKDTFSVVLIDEIETLTTKRDNSINNNEPADGIRVSEHLS